MEWLAHTNLSATLMTCAPYMARAYLRATSPAWTRLCNVAAVSSLPQCSRSFSSCSSSSSTHSLLACNVLFFIDKLQSIFTNGIILKILLLQLLQLLLLLLVKRIVICFSMHLLLFSQRSLSEVTTLSSICTHSGQQGEQRDLAAFARCALCHDSARLDFALQSSFR